MIDPKLMIAILKKETSSIALQDGSDFENEGIFLLKSQNKGRMVECIARLAVSKVHAERYFGDRVSQPMSSSFVDYWIT